MKKLIIIFLLALCIQPVYSQEFVPGEIIIGFIDSVEGPEAIEILKEQDLQFRETTRSGSTYYFKCKDNNSHQLKEELEKSQLFTLVTIHGKLSNAILAYAKLKTTKDEVNNLINSLKNIEIDYIETSAIVVVATVPSGEENTYIEKISKHKKVKYAELNSICYAF